ncbi:hypothetical protein HK101_009176 [Irineochytrium annulatum]|nr:hypothetical protein HK101_009176 [Irineochytrium annulatum]
MTASSFYDIPVRDFRKQDFNLNELRGKCGFTPQYAGLEKLWQNHKDSGLVILGFPTNDFKQEPLEGEELVQSCSRDWKVSFPIMEKIHVNGSEEHDIYKFLKSQRSGILGLKMIKWNFEKFLIAKDGTVVNRYASTSTPEGIEKDIKAELAK